MQRGGRGEGRERGVGVGTKGTGEEEGERRGLVVVYTVKAGSTILVFSLTSILIVSIGNFITHST